MIKYTTGDLLKSPAQALVNTVNCEGYMGKGIAYQFKLQYPENNADYMKACKSGRLTTGRLHHFVEKGKIIINFPTKNKWREKSKMVYIDEGLDQLLLLIDELSITGIAIPPLGSGNGGLIWADVKILIEQKLSAKSDDVDILVYEPSKNFSAKPTAEPKLSASALVLMQIKESLTKFSKVRLQKTAYFTNLFLKTKYFKFVRYHFGPYDYSIELISRGIREFQQYHATTTTAELITILHNKITSESVERKMAEIAPQIERASLFVNGIESDYELECLSTICFIAEENGGLDEGQLIREFKLWSEDKSERFPEETIAVGIKKLYEAGILDKNIAGYIISSQL
ncbi:MAG: macro domain-containing protein [Defluviitaleaceae bacterium]|nr:macro domain-containing protein [Defluviitaleaceae bacterium]